MTIFQAAFWRDALERAVKTAAQSAILGGGFTSTTADGLHLDWLAIGGFALGGFVLSVLSSVGSVALTGTPSAVKPSADQDAQADQADDDQDGTTEGTDGLDPAPAATPATDSDGVEWAAES